MTNRQGSVGNRGNRQNVASSYQAKGTPKYRHYKPKDIGYAQHQGKRFYFSGKYGSQQSVLAYQEWLAERFPVATTPAAITFAELCLAFLQAGKRRWGNGTRTELVNFRCAIKLFLSAHAATVVSRFRGHQLRAFALQLAERGKHKQGYINKVAAKMRQVIRWGISHGLCECPYWAEIAVAQGIVGHEVAQPLRSRRVPPVEWATVAKTIEHVTPTIRAMVLFQWHTGARSQSICSATREQFTELAGRTIWHPVHKTQHLGHDLRLPIGPKALEILETLPQSGPLFRNRRGGVYTPNGYCQAIRKAAKKAGVTHWHPHQLRHAFGQRVKDNLGIESAQALLGHASIQASQIYADNRLHVALKASLLLG